MEDDIRRRLRGAIVEAAEQTDNSDSPFEAIDRVIYHIEQEFDGEIIQGSAAIESKTEK